MGTQQTPKPNGRTSQTRGRILRLAEQLYYRGGYAGISLQHLADDLGLTKAALFHHFRSKQDLFFAMLLAMVEQRSERIEAAIASAADTRGRLRAILRAMSECPFFDPMKFLTDERGKLRLEQRREMEIVFAHGIQEPIARVLREGIAGGALRPHRTELAVMLFLNLLMLLPAPGHPNPRQTQADDLATYIEELLTCFLWGIGQDPGASAEAGGVG